MEAMALALAPSHFVAAAITVAVTSSSSRASCHAVDVSGWGGQPMHVNKVGDLLEQAKALYCTGIITEAVPPLLEAIDLAPTCVEARAFLAIIYDQTRLDDDEALSYYEQAMALTSVSSYELLMGRGGLYYRTSQFALACRDFERASAVCPDCPIAAHFARVCAGLS